jgi:hypothetical protein
MPDHGSKSPPGLAVCVALLLLNVTLTATWSAASDSETLQQLKQAARSSATDKNSNDLGREQTRVKPESSAPKAKSIAEPKTVPNKIRDEPARRKEEALRLLETVLAGVHRISPVEYALLTQVEAASLLWPLDRERALTIVNKAGDGLRELFEKEKESQGPKANAQRPGRKEQRLRFLLLRKIARLSPDLVSQFSPSTSPVDSAPRSISGEWSDEARAIMSVAEEQLEVNSEIAVKLARQSLPFGLVDWVPFLRRLSSINGPRAEQVATALMQQYATTSVSPLDLLRLDRFALEPGRSPRVREQFYEALYLRLTLSLKPESPTAILAANLQCAKKAVEIATVANWQVKFQHISSQYESLLSARSAPVPDALPNIPVDLSSMRDPEPGETTEIGHSAQRAQRISDPKTKDLQFQKLASEAAAREDLMLAEELMSKIGSDEIRQETTLAVYGPFVRRKLNERDWQGAQSQALSITQPLGRTLAFELIAQMALRSQQRKEDVLLTYDTALWALRRDGSSESAATAYLIIARSLASLAPDRSRDAVNSAVFVLNNLSRNGLLSAQSEVGSAMASWVMLPIRTIRYDEALDLAEMIGPIFKGIAARDLAYAESTALDLGNLGLSSLAQLGIASELLSESSNVRTGNPRVNENKTRQNE